MPEWTPPSREQRQAADVMTDAVLSAIKQNGGIHAETAIAAAARLAGTFLFRSFHLSDIHARPGDVVLSEMANDAGPALIQTLGVGLDAMNVNLDESWSMSETPDENQPQLDIISMQTILEPELREVARDFGLNDDQAAHACTLTAARIIQMTSSVLDVNIGFGIATMGLIEGSKTMPPPLSTNPETKPS
ncbi:MAG: hypothetical protein C0478_18690 [Planctomyces sp.]|nr:hypothetical protein [Planctomyces sp.]